MLAEQSTYHGIPHGDIPLGHFVENLACRPEEAAFGIHIEERGGGDGVEAEAGFREAGMGGAAVVRAREG